jgi:hypothetical protein
MKRRLLPPVDQDELTPKSKKQVGKLQCFTEGLLEEIHAFEDLVGKRDIYPTSCRIGTSMPGQNV